MEGDVRRRVIVRGRVQGVCFRHFTREAAASCGVSGWVRNRPDGTVEAVGAGPLANVERWLAALHSGPTFARVDAVEDVAADPQEPLAGFEVRW